jgi:hypothetical protein
LKPRKPYWVERMNAARKAWAALRPGDRPAGRRPTAGGFSFSTKRRIAPGVRWEAYVQGHRFFWVEKDWELRVRLYLYDREVAALDSLAQGGDRSMMSCVSFDVLTAGDFLEGRDRAGAMPEFSFEATDEEVFEQLAAYSHRIDLLWRFAGGNDLAAFRKLAVSVMRNTDSFGSFPTGTEMICAAWAYGEPELAARLLEAYEAQWEEKLQDRAYDVLPNLRADLQAEFSRLRGMIGLPSKA